MHYFHGARFFDETQIVCGASLSGVRGIKVTYARCATSRDTWAQGGRARNNVDKF
jgi:hypothetical protein